MISERYSSMKMLVVACLWLTLVIDLCSCNEDYYASEATCEEKFSELDTMEAITFSVQCSSNQTILKWENVASVKFLFQLEYTCYNQTSGYNYTRIIESYSERENADKIITGLPLDSKDVYCIFHACIETLDDYTYYQNADTITCSYEDTIEQHPMAVNESSSVYLPAASSPSFTYTASTSSMHTYTTISSAADSFSIPASFPRPFPSTSNLHSSIESFSSPSLSISQPPLMDPVITTTTKTSAAVNTPNSKSTRTTETALGVIAFLVVLIGGTAIVILVIVCFSYRKWLRKTSSIEYDSKVKSEFADPEFGESVSVFSIDNISTNESNITVLQSLTIQSSYALFEESFESGNADTNNNNPANLEKLDLSKSGTASQGINDYEDIGSPSECSTVATLQTPLSTDDDMNELTIAKGFGKSALAERNTYSVLPTRMNTQVSNNQDYISDNSSYVREEISHGSNCETIPNNDTNVQSQKYGLISDGYITESSPDNEAAYKRREMEPDGYLPDRTPVNESGYKWRSSQIIDGYVPDRTATNEKVAGNGSIGKGEDSVFDGYISEQTSPAGIDNTRLQSSTESAYISGTSTSSVDDYISNNRRGISSLEIPSSSSEHALSPSISITSFTACSITHSTTGYVTTNSVSCCKDDSYSLPSLGDDQLTSTRLEGDNITKWYDPIVTDGSAGLPDNDNYLSTSFSEQRNTTKMASSFPTLPGAIANAPPSCSDCVYIQTQGVSDINTNTSSAIELDICEVDTTDDQLTSTTLLPASTQCSTTPHTSYTSIPSINQGLSSMVPQLSSSGYL